MINSSPDKKSFFLEKFLIFIILLGDILFVILSDLSAFTLRFETEIIHPPVVNFFAYLKIFIPIIAIRVVCFYIFGLYYNIKTKTSFEIILSAFKATLASSLIIVTIAFYYRALAYPRSVIFISWVLTMFIVIIWRIFLRTIIGIIFGKNFITSRIIIIGTNEEAQRLGLHMGRDSSTKYEILGFIKADNADTRVLDSSVTVLGTLEDIPRIIEEKNVDEAIIATQDVPKNKLISILAELFHNGISCKVAPQIYEAIAGNIIAMPLDEETPIFLAPLQERFYWYRGFKRIGDLASSIIILILAAPLIFIIALLIKITSDGPLFLKQERVGMHGKRFILYKFRTMHKDAEKESGPVWAIENDLRITTLGRFLRRTRLDELPQLFNVIKNEMSLVGPRPERLCFVETLKEEIPFYLERLTVKPGITGWAQITCPYADSIETSREKFIHDIFYIKNMSLALDLFILVKTFWTIIQEKGAH